MSKNKSALYILPWNDELILMYADQGNYAKFKAGDESAVFTARKLETSLTIEFENGKPVFSGIAP